MTLIFTAASSGLTYLCFGDREQFAIPTNKMHSVLQKRKQERI